MDAQSGWSLASRPGTSPLVQKTAQGLRGLLAKPNRCSLFPVEMLKGMVESVGPIPSMTGIRLLVVCLLVFAGFMRYDEPM